jgi:hypothetical protein
LVKAPAVAQAVNTLAALVVLVVNKVVVVKVQDKAVLRQSMAENTVVVVADLVPAMVVVKAVLEQCVLFGAQAEHFLLLMSLK